MIEASISVGDPESLVLILGTKDQHLKQIREAIPANFSTRDGKIYINGDEQAVIQATTVLEELRTLLGPRTADRHRSSAASHSPRHEWRKDAAG